MRLKRTNMKGKMMRDLRSIDSATSCGVSFSV